MQKIIGVLFILLLIGGCSSNTNEFIPSTINSDFPVPASAKETEGQSGNPNILQYQKYNYSKADEISSIHEEYLKAIKNSGWTELKEEQLGAVRFFEKEKQKVAISTHDGFFTLNVMKN